MTELERRMEENDLRKLQYDNNSSLKLSFIFMVVGFFLLYYLWDSDNLFVKILCGIFAFFGVLGFWEYFFGKKKKKDQREKMKIVVETKIVDKKTIIIKGGEDPDEIKYRLVFEKSKSYDVKKNIFNKIQIGNEIKLEYAKHSKCILNIYTESMNVENDSCLQQY